MTGDISDTLPIPDAAGIVPRVLQTLFAKLGDDEAENIEHSVKCSFIELYNEELRDLLSADDTTKLKIYDEANKSGRTTTLVQGMEESHIKTASKGIQLLREGSHKRQVAATKCNDLSSRSHTVFTVTVYMKKTTETGEDYVCSGKLNLVDLAGSENIQRSGAEHKRAAEAGLINKSLLTLGRVINALVDKGSHIPYRESKLTRLLQDSLGGQTKTCIIATLSPAKSNLEETISTLDYAFRAKNIRNKPQVNQTVSKKTLLKEFTAEIEKLKSELIATRQRNGVYLTSERYEEITTESESRRILADEQRDKIETMEANLRNKVTELFALTNNFQSLKRNNEETRMHLQGTKSILEKAEIVLAHTRKNLAEETELRKAHQETEVKLTAVGEDLLGTLGTTTDHIGRLHSKLRRRSELQTENRGKWSESQTLVSDTTSSVEERIEALRTQQETLLEGLSGRMRSFVSDEMRELESSQSFLKEKAASFEQSEAEVNAQTGKSKDGLNEVLEEIRTLREDVKQKVGAGLNDLSAAAQRISAGISTELDAFHGHLQDSYVSLGREFKTIFSDLIARMEDQKTEAQRLREQMAAASSVFMQVGQASQVQLQNAVEQERQVAATERQDLLAKITGLINDSAATQEARLSTHIETANKRIKTSEEEYSNAQLIYCSGMDDWSTSASSLVDSSVKSREAIKSKLKGDWGMANDHTTKITETTKAVHGETVRIVDGQMAQMDSQLVALDEIVSRVKAQNEVHHAAHTASLSQLAGNVQESYRSIEAHFQVSYQRTQTLDTEMQDHANALQQTLPELSANGEICEPLRSLREALSADQIAEYQITGETPAKTAYTYPTVLPRTEAHDTLLDRMRGVPTQTAQRGLTSPTKSPSKRSPTKLRSPTKAPSSPLKGQIFADAPPKLDLKSHRRPALTPLNVMAESAPEVPTLREVDVNVVTPAAAKVEDEAGLKRPNSASAVEVKLLGESRLPMKRRTVAGLVEGSENLGERGRLGRRLRSRGSD